MKKAIENLSMGIDFSSEGSTAWKEMRLVCLCLCVNLSAARWLGKLLIPLALSKLVTKLHFGVSLQVAPVKVHRSNPTFSADFLFIPPPATSSFPTQCFSDKPATHTKDSVP